MEEINNRIKDIRNSLELSQEEFAIGLKRSRSNIAKIEAGKAGVTERLIDDLVLTYKVNRKWLESGKGTMFGVSDIDERLAVLCGQLIGGNDEFKKSIILSYLELDNTYWSVLEKNLLDNLKLK